MSDKLTVGLWTSGSTLDFPYLKSASSRQPNQYTGNGLFIAPWRLSVILSGVASTYLLHIAVQYKLLQCSYVMLHRGISMMKALLGRRRAVLEDTLLARA
jgi:hypothetical protein